MAELYRDGAISDRAGEADWTARVVAPPIVPALERDGASVSHRPFHRSEPQPSACPEIDCVRNRAPQIILKLAEQRAAEAGVGADKVLITWGIISEETYVAALAASLGLPFEPLGAAAQSFALSSKQLAEAAVTGMLPLVNGDGVEIVVAPRLVNSRRLVEVVKSGAAVAQRIRLTSTPRLQAFITHHRASPIARQAIDGLRSEHPEFSAGAGHPRLAAIAMGGALAALAAWVSPRATYGAIELALGFVFFAWTALRLLGFLSGPFVRRRPNAFSDSRLPIYTVIVALHREAATVADLIDGLRRLNYPQEKLDVKLVVEPDDDATRAALDELRLGPPFEIIVAPAAGPRTKPKALNAALPFARGKFIAVFDAEDRPEPDQLRLAVEAFVAGDERLACVQARLTIDNAADSWLTRLFTAEYAGLFDVFLPGLAAWRLPLPLGGSSNHFRTSVLRQVGAWDPFNVTEDADLGMRFARFGYRTAMISSSTYEEAPARFGPWLRQRTRWFKGWMQTWLVHMRNPIRLFHELGPAGFAVFQLVVGGTVLAALVHALFAAGLVVAVASAPVSDMPARLFLGFDAAMLLAGYFASAVIAMIGLMRRGLLGCAWALLLIPIYWLLLSLAAWRALFQLLRDPYRWDKTEHGLARTSRLAQGLRDSA